MASTFPGLTLVGSLVAPGSRVLDDKVAVSSSKLSSLASISSSSLGRRKNVALRKTRSSQITAASKELYFNKDGSAIKNSSFKGVVLQQGWLSHQETACVSVNKLADLVGVTLGPKEEMLYLKASMVLQKLPMMELLWLERSNWKIQLRTWELNWSDKQLPKLMTWQEMGQQHVLFLHKVSLLKVSR